MLERLRRAGPLPDPTFTSVALGALIIELERDFPGISERLAVRLGQEAERSKVARIGGPTIPPAARREVRAAAAWAAAIALVCASLTAAPLQIVESSRPVGWNAIVRRLADRLEE